VRHAALTIILLSLFFLGGCSTTNVVSGEYSPRLSSRGQMIKLSMADRSNRPTFFILNFEDERKAIVQPAAGCRKKGISKSRCSEATESNVLMEPNVVWVGRGIHKYELADKTVTDYLRDALVFDLNRFGFIAIPAEPGGLTAAALEDGKAVPSFPDGAKYVLGVWVSRFRPAFDQGWSNVTATFAYSYRIVLWNTASREVEVDESISREIQGLPVPGVTFADMTDRLMNIHLADMNIAVAELLVTYD
jgi:hypothetical protein